MALCAKPSFKPVILGAIKVETWFQYHFRQLQQNLHTPHFWNHFWNQPRNWLVSSTVNSPNVPSQNRYAVFYFFAPNRKNIVRNIACLSNFLFNFDWFLHVWCKIMNKKSIPVWVCFNSVFYTKLQKYMHNSFTMFGEEHWPNFVSASPMFFPLFQQ